MHSQPSSTLNSANSFKLTLLVAVVLLAVVTPVRADVCVWRDPERTMQRIFPQARDYKTLTVKVTPDKVAAIEESLGAKMDESEKKEFNFYDITGGSGKMGTIMALAGKGEYGTIEVVIGVDPSGRIVGTYIQRSRERVSRALQSPEFLNQFAGKTNKDGFDNIKPASPDAKSASGVVASVIKKMLVFHDVLTKGS